MIEKKQSASWYIAATHWLTSGFAIPLILGFITGMALALIFGEGIQENIALNTAVAVITFPLYYWLGVMYSARYINKKYFIKDGNEIVILATTYLILAGGGLNLFNIISGSGSIIEGLGFILVVITFYVASKKYIHTTPSTILAK